jgi:hypothetical protein
MGFGLDVGFAGYLDGCDKSSAQKGGFIPRTIHNPPLVYDDTPLSDNVKSGLFKGANG